MRPSRMITALTLLALFAWCGTVHGQVVHPGDAVLEAFDGRSVPANLETVDARASRVRRGPGIRARLSQSSRPGVTLRAPDTLWDWSAYEGLSIEVHNPGTETLNVFAGVESYSPDGRRLLGRNSREIHPGERAKIHLFFTHDGTGPFAGLRAIPIYGIMSMHGSQMPTFLMEPARVKAVSVYLLQPERAAELEIGTMRLFVAGSPEEQVVPFPFVDRFGQYIHRDFLGKIRDEADLERQRVAEAEELRARPGLPGLDRFGGWADGPRLEATGWFRVEQVDGKWWLVTPEGTLFMSFGINCFHTGDSTRVSGFESWFEEVPSDGRFYELNLRRKYGENYFEQWRDVTFARMRSWGYNTIGNWSRKEVLLASPLPFTVTLSAQGVAPRIEGSTGFWGKLADVYTPDFAEKVDEIIGKSVEDFKDNPLVVGYFVDNEMSWNAVHTGPLASPPDQPARVVLIDRLKAKYGTIAALNAAWSTDAADWDALRAPTHPNEQAREDLDAYAYAFALHYFDAVRAALRRHAPHHLYLGCRFMQDATPEVVRACADRVDVVSVNRYNRAIRSEDWTGENDLGKPVIVGEFHFGAADRNMLHPSLVPTETQAERAEAMKTYVRSVVDCPAFVGCHWFQYMDQPVTGRGMDLESFNTGLVTEIDFVYPEMAEAAREVFAEAYRRRYEGR